jgi:pterin-4a-carbinolamine dehydratase
MASFEDFYNDLARLVEKYKKSNTPLKLEQDLDNDIIKIFGEKLTALARAKNGLNDVEELAYTTAEHHPYWNVLYNSSEIANTILEKWNDDLSKEDIEEIEWAIKEIAQTMEKIKEKI